jgi:hypothetical protein
MFRVRLALGSAVAAVVVVFCGTVTPAAAAADSTVVEAESMTVTPFYGGGRYRDTTASAAAAVQFYWPSSVSRTLSLPTPSAIFVRARGIQCHGAPIMHVSIDGIRISSGGVTATTWTDYSAAGAIAAGTHRIGIAFVNPYIGFDCIRKLLVDTVIVAPNAAATPPDSTPSDSLTVAPKDDLPGWTHIFADDFDLPAATGSWANASDPNKIVYVGAQGQQWRTYPSTYTDTYQHRPYRPDAVLSVADGTLNFDLHDVDGQPAGANPSPILGNGSQYQTYGRYSARLRVDTPGLSQYYAAWLLWPESETWPTDGEDDFPEGALDGTVSGFHHYARAAGGQEGVDTGAVFTDWHTYTMEWSPGLIRYLLDDVVVFQSTHYVPTKPMRWQLQTETKGNGTHQGHLLVDWVSVWAYHPGA